MLKTRNSARSAYNKPANQTQYTPIRRNTSQSDATLVNQTQHKRIRHNIPQSNTTLVNQTQRQRIRHNTRRSDTTPTRHNTSQLNTTPIRRNIKQINRSILFSRNKPSISVTILYKLLKFLSSLLSSKVFTTKTSVMHAKTQLVIMVRQWKMFHHHYTMRSNP